MPLIHGKSPKAFSKNVATEMHHGHPLNQSLAIAYATKRRAQRKMAHGGEVEAPEFIAEEMESGYVDHEGNFIHHNHAAEHEDARMLNQHGEHEEGPEDHMAHGGFIGSHQGKEHEMDMVGRIMKMHQQHYSQGGKVANRNSGESASEPDDMAKAQENEFDDLALRDDLAFNYTDANSGDEIGDHAQDERDQDVIRRVMASRKKRDRNPVPA